MKIENITDELKVKEYINKYLKELQRHFNMSDRKMRIILYKIYKETSSLNIFKVLFIKSIKNINSMLKSIYRKIQYRKN